MRILVVEDDSKIASFVVNGLKQNGFAVDHAADGERGLALASTVNYDAVVLDLMLPKLDGLSVVGQLRAQGGRVPVLILSARASVDDRVKGLQRAAMTTSRSPSRSRSCSPVCRRLFAGPRTRRSRPA